MPYLHLGCWRVCRECGRVSWILDAWIPNAMQRSRLRICCGNVQKRGQHPLRSRRSDLYSVLGGVCHIDRRDSDRLTSVGEHRDPRFSPTTTPATRQSLVISDSDSDTNSYTPISATQDTSTNTLTSQAKSKKESSSSLPLEISNTSVSQNTASRFSPRYRATAIQFLSLIHI